MDYKEFLKVYNQLSDIQQEILQNLIRRLCQSPEMQISFGKVMKGYISQMKKKTGFSENKIMTMLVKEDSDDSKDSDYVLSKKEALKSSMRTKRKGEDTYTKEIVEKNLEQHNISMKDVHRIGLGNQIADAQLKLGSFEYCYEHLTEQEKKAVSMLVIELYFEKYCPEFFESNEYEYEEREDNTNGE